MHGGYNKAKEGRGLSQRREGESRGGKKARKEGKKDKKEREGTIRQWRGGVGI